MAETGSWFPPKIENPCVNIFFFSLFGQPSFLSMVKPVEQAPICLSLEEVEVHAGHEGLMEVDYIILLNVGNPQDILDQQLIKKPLPMFTMLKRYNIEIWSVHNAMNNVAIEYTSLQAHVVK